MTDSYFLAADIGATNTRLRFGSVSAASRAETLAEIRVPSGGAAEIKTRISDFVRRHLPPGAPPARAAVLGLPGKISQDRRSCAISYQDPDRFVSFQDLFDRLEVEEGMLLNDLECGVLGIPQKLDQRMQLLCGERLESERRNSGFVLGMPGSGLGIGLGLGLSGSRPSEGGHLLAALDLQDELERRVARSVLAGETGGGKPQMPTYEDLLRAAAIPLIFAAMAETRGGSEGQESAARALEPLPLKEQPRAVEKWASSTGHRFHDPARDTFSLYGRFLGRLMQAQALTLLPGAVYLGGGIVMATHRLFADAFVDSFRRHRVHGGYLRRLPVYVVANPQLNLDGAARKAAELVAKMTPLSDQERFSA